MVAFYGCAAAGGSSGWLDTGGSTLVEGLGFRGRL